MTNKTIKTVLFAVLVTTMILPMSGMNLAEAQNTSDKIPDDKLMERTGDNWKAQYKNDAEFEASQNTLKTYVAAELPDNGWNQAMVKDQIRIQNFDTIIEKRGFGHEIVALVVAKEQILGTYDSSDAVAQYHEWVTTQTNIPKTVEEIDQRLSEIVDTNSMKLVPHLVETYNDMAEHGNVPKELIEKDVNFWIMTGNVAVCSYDEECNEEELKELHLLARNQPQDTKIPVIANPMDYILPEAFAVTSQEVIGYVFSYPIGCTGCSITDTDIGLSPEYPWTNSGQIHAGGTDLYTTGSACSAVNDVSTKIVTHAEVGEVNKYRYGNGGTCAYATATWTMSHTDGWPWNFSGVAEAWT
ncbi:MAG: hypothetical protein ACR2LL_12485 [Nitrosopumilus sp.]